MKRIFGVAKEKKPPPTLEEANDKLNKRGDTIDEKIRKLDAELVKYRQQIQRTRPGPAQEALKARAMRVLKQKKMFEGQRDQLYQQSFNVEQVAFASEGLKDAQHLMTAMKSANKDLKAQMKSVRIDDIDRIQDDMADLVDYSSEVQETLGRSYGVPDDIDEDDLMGELDALEADMGREEEGVPSYLQEDKEELQQPAMPGKLDEELRLPSAPLGNLPTSQQHPSQAQYAEGMGLPSVPRAGIRS
eukprot:TRINITY_DN2539_c0_g1_i6.p1 TRINITY_DN2539_c0_g1~~TRINITY_DN2539_c0_g1_i6.p1  ORF type:complete len:245 (-),score=74.41 TRINITY_DN2539_c0_g1_i6:262-996(-)